MIGETLEGEASGPIYSTTSQRASDEAPRSSGQPTMNGVGMFGSVVNHAAVPPSAAHEIGPSETLDVATGLGATTGREVTTGLGATTEPGVDHNTHHIQSTAHTHPHTQQSLLQAEPLEQHVHQQQPLQTAPATVSEQGSQIERMFASAHVEFSPPEEIPEQNHQSRPGSGGQMMWMMRLGEFFQRRVSQAGAIVTPTMDQARTGRTTVAASTPVPPTPMSWSSASPPLREPLFAPDIQQRMQQWATRPSLINPQPNGQRENESSAGSLTQEQILAEVHRQVQLAMRGHESRQRQLEDENQQLREQLRVRSGNAAHISPATRQQALEGNLGRPLGDPGLLGQGGGNLSGLSERQGVGLGNVAGVHAGGTVGAGEGGVAQGPRYGSLQDPAMGVLGPGASGEIPAAAQHGHERSGAFPPGLGVGGSTLGPASGGAGVHGSGAAGSADPMDLLMQGMAQLQSAMAVSMSGKAGEPEVVKPGSGELPKLPDLSENSAIDVGDWIHALGNAMGDLSNTSSVWWAEILKALDVFYKDYIVASPVGKLSLKPEAYETATLKDVRWTRVDKRAATMILASLPNAVSAEILASRLVGTLQVLTRVIVLYRPGSTAERQQILKALESPPSATTATEAVEGLRRWARWRRRAGDVGLTCPDPTILLRGLDGLTKKVLGDHSELAFRLNMTRYTLEVDTKPSEKGVMDLHQALLSELEQVAFRGRAKPTNVPSLKTMTATTTGATSSGSGGVDHGGGNKNKAAGTPCKFFLTDNGCKKGSKCQFSHEADRRQKQGRCWMCGSKAHQQKDCPTKEKSESRSPTNKGGQPVASQTTSPTPASRQVGRTVTATTGASTQPTVPSLATMATPVPEGSSPSMPTTTTMAEAEMRSLISEVNATLKEMRQLKAASLSVKDVNKMVKAVGCDPITGRSGLLDSGASHPFRTASEGEVSKANRVRVQLANGSEVVLAQNQAGTLLAVSPGEGDETAPIVPMGSLVQDLGCELSWTRKGGLKITHPVHGTIRPHIVGSCPLVGEACALDLIKELEESRVRALRETTLTTASALWTWDQAKPWAQHLENFVKTGTRATQLMALDAEDSPLRHLDARIKATLAEEIDLSTRAGWSYLKALPLSRHKRRRMMTQPWVVHLYAGKGKGLDPILKEVEDGKILVEIDIEKSKAFDMRKVAGAYRAILWASARGMVTGIIGSPPCRGPQDEQLVAKQVWLTTVAKASRAMSYDGPVFAMIEGEKVLKNIRDDSDGALPGLKKSWGTLMDDLCLEEFQGTMFTNLDMGDSVPSSTRNGCWTNDFKETIVQAVRRWEKEPEMVQVGKWMAKMDADPHAFLSKLTEKELKFWKTHIKNNHIPYDRRCRTCVVSTGTGRSHRRVKTPSAHCLSLDICGPFRKRGIDPDHRDYRYALIGAYCLPKFHGEIGGSAGKFHGEIGGNADKFDGETGGNAGKFHGETGGNAGKFDGETGGNADKFHGEIGGSAGKFHGEIGGSAGKFHGEIGGNADKFDGETGGNAGKFHGETGGNAGKFDGETGGNADKFHGEIGGSAGKFHGEIGGSAGKFDGETGDNADKFDGETGGNAGKFDGETGGNAGKFDGETGGNADKFHGEIGGNAGKFHGETGGNAGKFDGETGGNAGKFHGEIDSNVGRLFGIEAIVPEDIRDSVEAVLPDFKDLFGETDDDLPLPTRADPEAEGLPKGLNEEEFARIFNEVDGHVEYKTIYIMRPLRSRTAREVAAAVQDMVLELRAEGLQISRMHADRARELRTIPLRRWMLDRGIYCTYTEGQAPQSNGRAEAGVKFAKAQTKRLLVASNFPMETWPLAMRYATWCQKQRILGKPGDQVPFGAPVHVRSKVYGTGGRHDLNVRWKKGYYAGPSLDVRGGHVVQYEDGMFVTTMHVRQGLVDVDEEVKQDEFEAVIAAPTRRVRNKRSLEPLEIAQVEEEFEYDPDHPAELYAAALVDERDITVDQVETLATLLPHDLKVPVRHEERDRVGKIWSAGAITNHGRVTVRRSTRIFPRATKTLARFVKKLNPDFRFNAVEITFNIKASNHMDNHRVGKEMVIALSDFEGGGVKLEQEGDSRVVSLSGSPQYKDSGQRYTVMPWRGDDRVVLTAFSVENSGILSRDDTDCLKALDFEWNEHFVNSPQPMAPSSASSSHLHSITVGLMRESGGVSSDLYDVQADMDLIIQDLEERAVRLRGLLEEEEVLQEEYKRLGETTRESLEDTRNQVAKFLEEIHERMNAFEKRKTWHCLKAAKVIDSSPNVEETVDYETLLLELEGDLEVVHTVPLDQVKRVLDKWTEAIKKEVEALFSSGTLTRVSVELARKMEKEGTLKLVPSKCVFTLKPPQVRGQKCRRKCRLVLCGNYIDKEAAGDSVDLYASGTSSEALRAALVLSSIYKWAAATSDVTGAFLLATWPPELPKYGIMPPRIVKDVNLASYEAWIVQRPLYGLRESPAIWNMHRNRRLKEARVPFGQSWVTLTPTTAEPDLWVVREEATRDVLGLVVTYVDDLLYLGSEELIKALHEYVEVEWPTSSLEWINEVTPVRYLGVEILRNSQGDYSIGQQAYIQELVRAHNMQDAHYTTLPVPREWLDQAEQNLAETEGDFSEEELRFGQRMVGELLWLAMKSRPDLLFVINHMASLVSRRPIYVARVGRRVLSYVAGSAELRLVLSPRAEHQREIVCFTDASFAPYGARSFGAAVIALEGAPVSWKAGRQSFVTMSVMEAELYAATQGCVLLESMNAILEEVLPGRFKKVLAVDNTSAVAMCNGGHGSQRTRHLKVRASFLRESVEQGQLEVRHTPGEFQLADLATKLLPRTRLTQLLDLWGFVGQKAAGMLEQLRTKLISAMFLLASLFCPGADGAKREKKKDKEDIPLSGYDELLVVTVVTCICAIGVWELLKWAWKQGWRYCRNLKRSQRLKEVSQLAAQAARQEVQLATRAASRRASGRTTGQSSGVADPRDQPILRARGRSSGETERSASSTPTRTRDHPFVTPPRPAPPVETMPNTEAQNHVLGRVPDMAVEGERFRVCTDVLMLLTVEALKDGLRHQGLQLSGLKEDQAKRLAQQLGRPADADGRERPTTRQLKYILWLWRDRKLHGRCRLTWEDLKEKTQASNWIAVWKDA